MSEKNDKPMASRQEWLQMLHKRNMRLADTALSELISTSDRFSRFSCELDGVLLDFSAPDWMKKRCEDCSA